MSNLFIINTLTAWDEPPRARHQFTFALAGKHKVVFVERSKTGKRKIETSEIQENITLFTPFYPVNYRLRYRIPLLNELYQNWLFKNLRKTYGDNIIVNFDFSAYRIFLYFKQVIYYCNDEFKGNSKYRNYVIEAYKIYCERQIIRRSIFCIATSRYLKTKLSLYNLRTYEIPLGVSEVGKDVSFRGKQDNPVIVVCLLGVINERQISVSLINSLLKDDSLHLILIGSIEDGFLRQIDTCKRMTLRDVLRGKELTDALSQVDVGLALYNVERINPGATPNKLWQYLSVGIPVVISEMPNLDPADFPASSVYILKEDRKLKELIFKAYHENSEQLFKDRIEFARNNTWDKRIVMFLEKLRENIPCIIIALGTIYTIFGSHSVN